MKRRLLFEIDAADLSCALCSHLEDSDRPLCLLFNLALEWRETSGIVNRCDMCLDSEEGE